MELIPPDTLTAQLQQRLLILKEAQTQLTRNVKNQPGGHLRVSQKANSRPQYYHYTSPDDLTGKYICKKNINFAKTLAQKDYNEDVIVQIQKEITALEKYLSQTGCDHTNFYNALCPARRELITPVTLTDEQYANRWQAASWAGRPFSPDAPLLYTARGERVRSKSEVIIADTLYRHKIPYRYEYPLPLPKCTKGKVRGDSGKFPPHSTAVTTFYPDFLCLNVRTRAEFFWEHFGLMDDPDYSKNAAGKVRLYTENGIIPGRRLIITMETQEEPLSTRVIENLIEEYLLSN